MFDNFLKVTIKYLLKLQKNFILNRIISKLLDYIKEGAIKTRYGYYIYFKATNPVPTSMRKAAILGIYEMDYLTVLKRLVEPGDFVIDGGAHEGYVSLLMSGVVGKDGRVFSIEPNIENLNYFRQNVKLNNAKNIVLIDKAISDMPSKSVFYCNEDEGEEGSLIPFSYHFGTKKSVLVDVDTLDNLFYKPEYTSRIKLLKLDIEGNEFKAIMGAKRIISECKPHIAFEVSLTYWAYLDTSIDVLF